MTSRATKMIKRLYFRTTGYSYTNLGRLFLRLFVGVMLMQFGIRQWIHFDTISTTFPDALGIGPEATLTVMITIEIVCSTFIMMGFLTRLMLIPPFLSMLVAEWYLLQMAPTSAFYMLDYHQQGYLPIMFMGIYFFLALVGPGKISVDYFLSLHMIHTANQSEGQLEEV